MTIRESVGGDLVFTKDITTFTSPTIGRADLTLTSEETVIEPGTYVADMQYRSSATPPVVYTEIFRVTVIGGITD